METRRPKRVNSSCRPFTTRAARRKRVLPLPASATEARSRKKTETRSRKTDSHLLPRLPSRRKYKNALTPACTPTQAQTSGTSISNMARLIMKSVRRSATCRKFARSSCTMTHSGGAASISSSSNRSEESSAGPNTRFRISDCRFNKTGCPSGLETQMRRSHREVSAERRGTGITPGRS